MDYNRQGMKSVSIVGRLSTLWSVHYRMFYILHSHLNCTHFLRQEVTGVLFTQMFPYLPPCI